MWPDMKCELFPVTYNTLEGDKDKNSLQLVLCNAVTLTRTTQLLCLIAEQRMTDRLGFLRYLGGNYAYMLYFLT